jgi:5'-3' exonuclease
MILIDLNQILIGGLMGQINKNKVELKEDLIRHMVLNTLRYNIKQFKEYGEVILCCDNRKYWRKDIFPFYKAGRKKARDKSDLDWHMIFDMLAKFKQELREYFPYKVIDVEGAEADDIIGTLAPRAVMHENVLILSSDSDFVQLQMWNTNSKYKIKQYNPTLKKYVTTDNALDSLKEKIIHGDKGDGIPNVLSPGDCFVRDLRQKPIKQKVFEELMASHYGDWKDESARSGFSRNQLLIDLRLIPETIKNEIINTYEEVKTANKTKMLNYFIEKKLTNLMDVIEEF